MLALIRENSHNNDISVYYDYKKKKYYKITISDYGKNLIHNEFMGLNFFNKLRYEKKIFFKIYKKKNYRRLEIDKIEGVKAKYNNSFYKNSKYFEKIVNFYISKWPKGKNQIAHGDFTLDNIIFKKNNFVILDWEHFKKSKKLFFGYDLVYILLSGIILPGEKNFKHDSKREFKRLYKKLYNYKINKNFLNNPFNTIDKIIANIFTDNLIKSPKKFVTTSINKNFKFKIVTFLDEEVFNK